MKSTSVVVHGLLVLLIWSSSSQGFVLNTYDNVVKKAYRVNMPWLGMGLFCNGCPARSCEEDPAVVTGFCCGCARFFDSLPVKCSGIVMSNCPLNIHGLCHDYEYMLRCCC